MKRITEEVEISIELAQEPEIETGDEIFDHLLKTLMFYMNRSAKIDAKADLRHHLWEDTGIILGKTLGKEVNERKIARYGSALIPMDEALVLASVDLSRPYLVTDIKPPESEQGFSLTLVKQFLRAFSRSLEATIHLRQLSGENAHHVVEAGFKALGKSLDQALRDSGRVESTKGDRN